MKINIVKDGFYIITTACGIFKGKIIDFNDDYTMFIMETENKDVLLIKDYITVSECKRRDLFLVGYLNMKDATKITNITGARIFYKFINDKKIKIRVYNGRKYYNRDDIMNALN